MGYRSVRSLVNQGSYLLKRMSVTNMVIQRTHYEVKKALALEKSLQLTWRQSWDSRESCSFLEDFEKRIVSATENLALFQHHDGVTGTAERHVVVDYALRMHSSLIGLQEPMLASLQGLLTRKNDDDVEFQVEQTRSEYSVLSSVSSCEEFPVVAVFPLGCRLALNALE